MLSGGELRVLRSPSSGSCRELLVLDEPTTTWTSPPARRSRRSCGDVPAALFVVSHDRRLLETICDRLWVVDGGQAGPFRWRLSSVARGDHRQRLGSLPARSRRKRSGCGTGWSAGRGRRCRRGGLRVCRSGRTSPGPRWLAGTVSTGNAPGSPRQRLRRTGVRNPRPRTLAPPPPARETVQGGPCLSPAEGRWARRRGARRAGPAQEPPRARHGQSRPSPPTSSRCTGRNRAGRHADQALEAAEEAWLDLERRCPVVAADGECARFPSGIALTGPISWASRTGRGDARGPASHNHHQSIPRSSARVDRTGQAWTETAIVERVRVRHPRGRRLARPGGAGKARVRRQRGAPGA